MAEDTRTVAPKGVGAKPWIKMRTDLWDDPRVSALCDALETDEARVIGGLYRLWSLADSHSTDGSLCYTQATVDRKTGIDGFAQGLESVGWLSAEPSGVLIPEFAIHNGQSAKSRAQAAVRQQSRRAKQPTTGKRSRSNHAGSVTDSRQKRNNSASRGDKSLINEEPPPPGREPTGNRVTGTENDDSTIWREAEEALVEAGLADATGTVRIAREREYSPGRILELISEWRKRPELGEGALAWRITNSPADRPISDGWPDSGRTKPPTETELQKLERLVGSKLREMGASELVVSQSRILG